jgi:hypothetical protein
VHGGCSSTSTPAPAPVATPSTATPTASAPTVGSSHQRGWVFVGPQTPHVGAAVGGNTDGTVPPVIAVVGSGSTTGTPVTANQSPGTGGSGTTTGSTPTSGSTPTTGTAEGNPAPVAGTGTDSVLPTDGLSVLSGNSIPGAENSGTTTPATDG